VDVFIGENLGHLLRFDLIFHRAAHDTLIGLPVKPEAIPALAGWRSSYLTNKLLVLYYAMKWRSVYAASSNSRTLQMWSVTPAAIAGVMRIL
jgi:hypothetical protein